MEVESFFAFCISVNLAPNPLLPGLYKGFFAVETPFFGMQIVRTVHRRLFRTVIELAHE